MGIHKEGRKLLLFLLLVVGSLNFWIRNSDQGVLLSNLVLVVSVIVFLLILQFFRNPRVMVIQDQTKILAPADGKVVVIADVEENEYFKSERTQVSIFMSPLNVHVNRNPVSGRVSYFKYHPGKYLVAWHPKSSTENERSTVVVRMANDFEVMYRQVAGAVARRIKYYLQEGDVVEQGSEFGFIKFGSRVDVILPKEFEIKVEMGQKTRAGITILAETN